jgi:hypothetical protein
MLGDATKGKHEIYHDEVHRHGHYERKLRSQSLKGNTDYFCFICQACLLNYVGFSKFLAIVITLLFDMTLQ